jgi:heme-degrading monooxygenase HmoA
MSTTSPDRPPASPADSAEAQTPHASTPPRPAEPASVERAAASALRAHHAGPLRPPYYVVVFTSQRNDQDRAGYYLMAERMVALATHQPGYLGMHSARGPNGLGITVSFWRNTDDILAWKKVAEHQAAQQAGQDHWYAGYELQVARVERGYAFGVPLTVPEHGPVNEPIDNEPGIA